MTFFLVKNTNQPNLNIFDQLQKYLCHNNRAVQNHTMIHKGLGNLKHSSWSDDLIPESV